MSSLELIQEVINEDLAIMHEIIQEDIMPLYQWRKEQEKKQFEKLYTEVKKFEAEEENA